VKAWITAVGAKAVYITPGSPWENGFVESFNARLRDELLDGDNSCSLAEVQMVIKSWRRHYNAVRPHASLGSKPSAPQLLRPSCTPARATAQPPPAPSPALDPRPQFH
jgi:transposase InsO family protein